MTATATTDPAGDRPSTEHPNPPRVGIVGGGQLGLMLCQAAADLPLSTCVLSPETNAPAAAAADAFIAGAYEDEAVAREFIAACDVVTFEFEAVPHALLDRLEAAEERGDIIIRPSLAVLRLIQNKADQKNWMVAHDIPTLPYQVLGANEQPDEKVLRRIGLPAVQKRQVGGYDGQGVQVLKDEAALSRLWSDPSLLEVFLHDRTEIAVVAARAIDGDTEAYVPTEMRFDEELNVLDTLVSPAQVSAEVLDDALAITQRIASALSITGVFAVEMFHSAATGVVVNEISPRVHNSGHHTIESSAHSQFEQHMRAVAGLPLGRVAGERPALTQNLLYTDQLAPLCGRGPGTVATRVPDTFVHWYGKDSARPWRKMGHVTALGADPDSAAARAREAVIDVTTNGEAAS